MLAPTGLIDINAGEYTLDVIQAMPEHRARINPDIVPDLLTFALALREQYQRTAQMTLSGTAGVIRARKKGQIAWARAQMEAIDSVCRALHGTLDMRAIDRVRAEWAEAMTRVEASADGTLAVR